MNEERGEVYDIGYRSYDGPREGRMRARKTVFVDGVRTTLGLGRSPMAKLLPAVLFLSVLVPAAVLALINVVAEQIPGDLPGHAGYYQIISVILLLFAAIIAPELLCPDRRDGVLSLYLVRPLTATDYLAGRWFAFLSVALALAYSGQVVLFVGKVLGVEDPVQYLQDNWLDVPRFLAAGLLVALFITTLPMAASAFTNRRAYAAAFVIGLFLISSAVAGGLVDCEEIQEERLGVFVEAECEPPTGENAKWYTLIGIIQAPMYVNDLIFDVRDNQGLGLAMLRELPQAVPLAWYALLVVGPGAVLWWRYRRITA